ncbi:MAG: hypothetical protein ACREA9_00660 [Pyrinomonadaceae bacterium]
MFAKNLERVLCKLCGSSDVSPIDPADIAERFESLRRYRRLPPGRENRAKHLSSIEITHAVLGLVARKPGWAGHAATLLNGSEYDAEKSKQARYRALGVTSGRIFSTLASRRR